MKTEDRINDLEEVVDDLLIQNLSLDNRVKKLEENSNSFFAGDLDD